MKILLLTHKPPFPKVDGGTIASFQVAKNLAEAGNEVHLLSMVTEKHPSSLEKVPPEIKEIISMEFVNVKTKVTLADLIKNLLFSKKPYTAQRFYNANFNLKLTEKLSNSSFDIVQLEGLYLSPYISTIKRISKCKISLRAHNVEYEIWKKITKGTKNPFKKYYFNNLYKRLKTFEHDTINNYDLLVPISKSDGIQFKKMGNTKDSIVIPVGVDFSFIKPENRALDKSIFYIGALDWKPNIEGLEWFLTKVWPEVQKEYPSLTFQIAGRNAPKNFIKKLNIAGVRYHGEIPDAYEFMNSYGIMVVPLFSGSGMRVKIIEAMANGKAIVTTRLGAEGIDVKNGDNILLADNTAGTIASLKTLLDNESFLKKIEKNAQALIQHNYSGLELGKKLTDFYRLKTH